MSSLAILGAGGHGTVAADIAELNGWVDIHFYDDDPSVQGGLVQSCTVVGNTEKLRDSCSSYDGVFIAIGDNSLRDRFIRNFSDCGANMVNLIHPSATVSAHARLGCGIIVMAGGVINPGAVIGSGSIINTNASVDHDCFLGRSVHLSPGARLGGGVEIGDYSWLGLNSSVKHNAVLGSEVIIGAGAAVVDDFEDNVVAVGVPAKKIKTIASNI